MHLAEAKPELLVCKCNFSFRNTSDLLVKEEWGEINKSDKYFVAGMAVLCHLSFIS